MVAFLSAAAVTGTSPSAPPLFFFILLYFLLFFFILFGMQRYEHFLKWQKIFLGGGKKELNLGPSGQRRATSSSARGVQIPCAVVCLPSLTRQVAVARFLVAFFAGGR
jgi:hypothetical protein